MKAFTVRLDDRTGSLVHITEALAGKGANLVAVGLIDAEDGVLVFVPDREEVAREALRPITASVTEHDVVELQMANEPGALARIARALDEAGTPIRLLLTLRATRGSAVDVIAVDDPDRAQMIIRGLSEGGLLD